ncbi:MAG: integrase [Verrucomicrobiaceae bacterium]|nr:MAG: integrase [Verrucomicrobiaceae bacterium]
MTGRKIADDIEAEVPILHRRILTLSEAREKTQLLRRLALAGRDPIAERDRDRSAPPTFRVAAEAAHLELSKGWKDKHSAAFLSTLKEHAFPALGNKRIDLIAANDIRDALAPIWMDIPVMARKVRQRIGTVLNFAKARGWRATEAPTKAVSVGLSKQPRSGNFAAMPYADVPAFFADQQGKPESLGRLALLFLIATAARSGEVRSARWSHIDRDGKLWNRPAPLMKNDIAHSVTLNAAALAILDRAEALRTTKADALIFPGSGDRMLSDMTINKVVKDSGQPFTPHGFRSSFRDFAAEQMPTIPDPVAEAALAHLVSDKVIAAYKRAKFLELRRKLLDGWGEYIGKVGGKVVMLAAV